MEEYIKMKKYILRQFGVSKTVINEIPWERFENETQCDNYCRTILRYALER